MGTPATFLVQPPLPAEYTKASDEELYARIARAKQTLGKDLLVLGHHYQRDEVIRFADIRGDSLKLARWAAEQREARYIIFCGVHFMAETADLLTAPGQAVILPDLGAGCSMADMAQADQVEECWFALADTLGEDNLLPVTYINSSAAVKAFVGERGGAVCTSSNAAAVAKWALDQDRVVLFIPDQHLGRNTAVLRLGIPFEEIGVWDRLTGRLLPDPHAPEGAPLDPRRLRVVIWNGYCSVHTRFTEEQIERARTEYGCRIVVHPECPWEIAHLADAVGSTEFIIKTVAESPPGSRWAIGTEINLVNRLAQEQTDKFVMNLDEIVCPCSTMFRISPQHLCWAMENLVAGQVVNRIRVPEATARWARVALDRMLRIS